MQLGMWALGVVSVALQGTATRLAEFGEALGIPPLVLAPSLDDLVGAGLMELRQSGSDRRYLLTEHGRDLHETVTALELWNDRWIEPEAVSGAALPHDVIELAAVLRPRVEITLLGGFSMTIGGTPITSISPGSQRLLIFLALYERTVSRAAVASAMWPDASNSKGAVNLRAALARLDPESRMGVVAASATLALATEVSIDLVAARALAHRLVDGGDLQDIDLSYDAVTTLSTELLPDWFDDWVLVEAEEWRDLRAAALEKLAARLLSAGRMEDAKRAARAAIRIDPLRETPRSILVRIHLAEGNRSDALSVFANYRDELQASLDLAPTAEFAQLLEGARL
ncbi:hypothetical protein BH11ACT3_BH11ACT3_15540 [soil metagenome]